MVLFQATGEIIFDTSNFVVPLPIQSMMSSIRTLDCLLADDVAVGLVL